VHFRRADNSTGHIWQRVCHTSFQTVPSTPPCHKLLRRVIGCHGYFGGVDLDAGVGGSYCIWTITIPQQTFAATAMDCH